MSDSYLYCDTVLDIPYTTFPNLLKQRAQKSPDEVVCIFIDDDRARSILTFGDLYKKATKFAKTLVQMGVKRGDIIGLNGRNVPEWLIADLGVQMAGGCSLCLPYQQKEETMVELFDAIGNIKLLIIDPGNSGQSCQIIKNILHKNLTSAKNDPAEVSKLLQIVLFSQHEAFPSLNNVQDLCSREYKAVLPRIDPEDISIIQLSSGTTGLPKAIPHSHHAMVVLAYHSFKIYPTNNKKEMLYKTSPFFWSAGYPYWEISTGGTRVTMTNAFHSISTADAALISCEIIAREKPTQAFFVPSMLDFIIKKNLPLKIPRILTGGTIVYSSVLESIGKVCDEYQVDYASTELGYIASGLFKAEDKYKEKQGILRCRPVPGVEIKITDEDGFLQPVGQRGKIWIRSMKQFSGYLNHEICTKANLMKSGWFCHEDGGFVTDDNALIVEGRCQEVIQVFGRKIYPVEIENAIKAKSNVIEAIVMPIKDMETGDLVPTAAIIYRPHCEDSMEFLQDYLRKELKITAENRLLGYMYVPHVIISLKDFPLLANGKPNRNEVRQIILKNVDCKKYDFSFKY
ncbi:uncharacterized protein LOC128160245 [Crassostrea angulata]|uniref:uncharacterized protein LOC128160245 n=1 Tax=Magallana angulata TaxID=2784310 RepID=UPI0022B12FDD|nr:uncharacterized protein LOC128160245 [Crassostrea angulata]